MDEVSGKLRGGFVRVFFRAIPVSQDSVLCLLFLATVRDKSINHIVRGLRVIRLWRGKRVSVYVSSRTRLGLTRGFD